MIRTAIRQKGLSPKVLADLLVSIATFALLALVGVDVSADPVLAAAVAKAAGFIAGVIAGPGRVVVEHVGTPNDEIVGPVK